MKLVAVICVRMSSNRLSGKPLCVYDEHSHKTNLECIIDRVSTSRHKPQVIVATSKSESDDPILALCSKKDWTWYRGDLQNVVSRFDGAIQAHAKEASRVWRVMTDNPLIDIGLVDHRIDVLERYKADLVVPILPEPTYAAQSNIWSRDAWGYCVKMSSGSLLEHPGEYLYENAGQFKTVYDPGPETVYYQPIRTELDTPEDLEFFKKVWVEYDRDIENPRRLLYTEKVINWLYPRPDIVSINAHIQIKTSTTYAHGHPRARNWICKECGHIIASKVNDGLAINCQKCGTERRFYP